LQEKVKVDGEPTDGDDDSSSSSNSSDDERGEEAKAQEEEKGFAFIDAEGNVVYLDTEEEEGDDVSTTTTTTTATEQPQQEALQEEEERGIAATPTGEEEESPVGGEKDVVTPRENEGLEAKGKPSMGRGGNSSTTTTPNERKAGVVKMVEEIGGLALIDGEGRVGPLPRINPAMTMRGHVLYVYGGVYEEGDREYNLDDCW